MERFWRYELDELTAFRRFDRLASERGRPLRRLRSTTPERLTLCHSARAGERRGPLEMPAALRLLADREAQACRARSEAVFKSALGPLDEFGATLWQTPRERAASSGWQAVRRRAAAGYARCALWLFDLWVEPVLQLRRQRELKRAHEAFLRRHPEISREPASAPTVAGNGCTDARRSDMWPPPGREN